MMTDADIKAMCLATLAGTLSWSGRELSDDTLAIVAEVPFTEDVAVYVTHALALLRQAKAVEQAWAMGDLRGH